MVTRSTRPNPSHEHELRRAALETLAILAGFSKPMPMPFIDGTRPDVAFLDPVRRTAFVGDAKASEGPDCLASNRRLGGYVRWARAAARGECAVVAVCYGELGDSANWERTLAGLASRALASTPETVVLAADVVVTWATVSARPANEQRSRSTQLWQRGARARHIRRP
jgi:hypothetical protein